MMNESFVKISTNWELVHGKIIDTLVTKILNTDSSTENKNFSSDLTDIASLDRSVNLHEISTNGNGKKCEISLEIFPRFLANRITLITDCQTIEIFINVQDEYLKTVYGELVDDFDGIKVYRFEIVLDEKLCCVKLLLKLIPKSPNIWIYGIQLEIHQNSSTSQAIFSHPNINLENVQNMLISSNQKLSPGAERCKAFLENYMRGNSSMENKACAAGQDYSKVLNCNSIQSFLQNKINSKPPVGANLPTNVLNLQSLSLMANLENDSNNFNEEYLGHNDLNNFKEFVLKKILESENRILQRLEQIEQNQNEKLNKILKLLEK